MPGGTESHGDTTHVGGLLMRLQDRIALVIDGGLLWNDAKQ
ncbi:hypothetical protein SAMN05216345_103424 [Cupriavidus sp. YR651]|nr:hypothetical protein SAMN05216345_103424 [Cupriavidus sp. YR651]